MSGSIVGWAIAAYGMVMRFAHLSPASPSAEAGLLDAPVLPPSTERAIKWHRASKAVPRRAKVVELPEGNWLLSLDSNQEPSG